jgi:glycosyltransferase involved in cell wall biosynthesis
MLTVLLATKNRAAILQETLEAFCHLQEPASGWKLVIADNGSTDQTSTVLASFANRLPLHAVSEPTGGKNSALNTGLRLVEGDLTVFTDDDTFPHSGWLIELRKAADAQPAYSLFGGAVVPRWESPPPPWVQWLEQGPTYALTDPSMTEGPMPPYLVFGPNMAIRTSVFQSGVRFDPSIGPQSSTYPMGSETELTLRLSQLGHQAWYVPTAVVEHFIRDYQLRQPWVLKRAIRYGRGRFRMDYMRKYRPYPCWFGVPRTFFRQIFEQEKMIIKAWLRSDHREFFSASWRRNFLWGHVIEARLSYRDHAVWRTAGAEG